MKFTYNGPWSEDDRRIIQWVFGNLSDQYKLTATKMIGGKYSIVIMRGSGGYLIEGSEEGKTKEDFHSVLNMHREAMMKKRAITKLKIPENMPENIGLMDMLRMRAKDAEIEGQPNWKIERAFEAAVAEATRKLPEGPQDYRADPAILVLDGKIQGGLDE